MFGHRPVVSSLRGMVAAAHPLAATAGASVLRQGGNAFDAVVATAAVLNVVEPYMSGLAGLGMASAWVAAEQRVRCLDFVSAVPRGFAADGLTRADTFHGCRASAAPGSLAAWAQLNAEYGRLPFARLLEPAIDLAAEGFPLGEGLPYMNAGWFDLRQHDREWLRVYGSAGLAIGSVLRQPDLAATLRAIAEQGPAYLYDGPLGERMCAHLRGGGGALDMGDLRAVAPRWREPLQVDHRGLRVHSLPPPAEAFQFLLTLGALRDIDLAGLPRDGVEHLDAVLRAIRLAAELRITHNGAGDAAIAALFEPEHLGRLGECIRAPGPVSGRTQRWQAVTDPALVALREHTTSFSAADAAGNMVCVTQSLGSVYGSGVVIPGTGVCMNNFLNWGDLDPASPNALVPGGPLAMCLAPSITLRAGQPVLALGTPGSYGILQTQVQVMVQHVDFGLDLQAAIEAPRVRLYDGQLGSAESRLDAEVVAGLCARGHALTVVEPWTSKVGGFHGISRDPGSGVLTGAADPRRDGYAVPA